MSVSTKLAVQPAKYRMSDCSGIFSATSAGTHSARFSALPAQMSRSPRSEAAIISNGGNVPRFSSWISLPRISIQLCSTGSCSWQRVLHTSQVVQTSCVSIALRSHFSRPSMTSRRYAYLPRGDWLSQPRPVYCSQVGTQ